MAKIYIHKQAFIPHFSLNMQSELTDIGVDPILKEHPQVILTDSNFDNEEQIKLFSKLSTHKFSPSSNQLLKQSDGDVVFADDFSHEQNMILIEGDHYVLFAGCAHKGILNIVNQAIEIMHLSPTHVFGGFHLHSRSTDVSESDDFILSLGDELIKIHTTYHTGHCTGTYAFKLLNEHFKERIQSFSTGYTITL